MPTFGSRFSSQRPCYDASRCPPGTRHPHYVTDPAEAYYEHRDNWVTTGELVELEQMVRYVTLDFPDLRSLSAC